MCTALVSLGLLASAAQAQTNVPTIALTRGVEFPEPFSKVNGLHELPDGRLLVADNTEQRILRIDFATGTVADAARLGAGPNEFQGTGSMISAPADRPAYFDITQSRLLRFDATGSPDGTVPLGGGAQDILALGAVLAIDTQGRVYSVTSGITRPAPGTLPTSESLKPADTIPLVRFTPGSARRDTVHRIPNPAATANLRSAYTSAVVRTVWTVPNGQPQDVFAILPDGRVAVLSGGEYRLRLVGDDGRETVGPPIPHQRIAVTPAMQHAATDSARVAAERGMAASKRASDLLKSRMPPGVDFPIPRMEIRIEAPATWATQLPPWSGIRAAGDGRLWVSVPRDLVGTTDHFDVLDPSGVLIARVTLPAGEALVSVTATVAYTMRTDADDLVYLKRYPLPAVLVR